MIEQISDLTVVNLKMKQFKSRIHIFSILGSDKLYLIHGEAVFYDGFRAVVSIVSGTHTL